MKLLVSPNTSYRHSMAAFRFITMPIILPITCDFFYKNNFEDNVTKYNQKIKLGNPNSTSDNLV